MSLLRQSDRHRKRVQAQASSQGAGSGGTLGNVVSWINGIVHGVTHFLQSPLGKFAEGVTIFLSPLLRFAAATGYLADRLIVWIENTVEARIMTIVYRLFNRLRGLILFYWQQTIKLGLMLFYAEQINMLHRVAQERQARQKAIAQLRAHLILRIKHLHQTIEKEAASGYNTGQPARTDLITKLADFIASNNPVVRGLVSDLIAGVIDLFGIESGPAALLIGFLARRIVDRLGVDKIVGHYLDDLLAPILGQPKPRNLHDVMQDVAQRLGALEAQWAQFYADGGSQVEQAGAEWQAITGPVGDVAILAWLGFAVADPKAWAASLNNTVGVVAEDAAIAVVNLLREV